MITLVQPDPYIEVRVDSNVTLRVEPYTEDRLHVRVERAQTNHGRAGGQLAPHVVTYFDIGLDQLAEIRRVGAVLIRRKMRQLEAVA